jgi:hypothetical protein
MALREGLDGCLFTELSGRRRIAVIADGVFRHLVAFASHGAG